MTDITHLAAQSTLPTLKILQPNDSYLNDNDILATIEREKDGFVFDANNADPTKRIFKLASECENPWVPLIKGTNNTSGRLEALVELTPTVFKDGDYIINFHDARFPEKTVFGMDRIFVYGGKSETPRPFQDWEIAARTMQAKMSAHKIAGSFGAMINEIHTRISRMEDKINEILCKLGPEETT